MEGTIDEKKANNLYKAIQGNKELSEAYKGADYETFKTTLDTNREFQAALHKDIVLAGLLSEDIDVERFRNGLRVQQPTQPSQPYR